MLDFEADASQISAMETRVERTQFRDASGWPARHVVSWRRLPTQGDDSTTPQCTAAKPVFN
jgi:hypothetical protein